MNLLGSCLGKVKNPLTNPDLGGNFHLNSEGTSKDRMESDSIKILNSLIFPLDFSAEKSLFTYDLFLYSSPISFFPLFIYFLFK